MGHVQEHFALEKATINKTIYSEWVAQSWKNNLLQFKHFYFWK